MANTFDQSLPAAVLEQTLKATKELAGFIAATRYDDLPKHIIEKAKLITSDNFSVALAGSSVAPEHARLRERLCNGRQEASILARDFPKTDAKTAAFLNATGTCKLELDEGCRPTGHPALHVLPPALALSQMLDKSGEDFLLALILGYDAQYRVQNATVLRRQVHPHGNFGHVGAVVALGKLSGWDAERIRQGMNCAAALCMGTSWQSCYSGATVRNTFPGLTAQTAFTVRDLVESGFTGYDGALADTFGFILGDAQFNPAMLTRELGEDFGVTHNYFKFHPCCALNGPSLDALADALGIVWRHGEFPPFRADKTYRPEEIESIRITVAENGLRMNREAQPRQLSGKFSVPFAVAAYLATGGSYMDNFTDDMPADENIRRLEKLVRMEGDASFSARWPAEGVAQVDVTLKDGRVLHGECVNQYGSAGNPPQMEDLLAKFRALAGKALSPEQCERLWERVRGLESQSMRGLFAL